MEGLYLFYGEEIYLLEDTVKKIKKSFKELIEGINYIKIDENNINQLIFNIETPCFGFDKKLIIVKNSGLLKKEKKNKNSFVIDLINKMASYLELNIEMVKSNNTIIFIEDSVEKNKLYKIIEKYGKIINFEAEKLPSLIKRIQIICSAYKVEISNENAKYLIECCGNGLQGIINELRKLIEYVGINGVIEKTNIDELTIKQIDSVIFDLTDSIGRKDIKRALEVFNNLIYKKESVQKIMVTLYNHFKKLYYVKIAETNNMNISEVLNLKANQTFLVTKYKAQSRYFKQEELRKILQEFIDLDYNYKKGIIDLNLGIESILCNYCG